MLIRDICAALLDCRRAASYKSYYPHMPIGKMWIYRLPVVCVCVCLVGWFVCFLCICTVTDFSAEDKAICVKFCWAVRRRPEQGISHFVELWSPEVPQIGRITTTCTTFTTITIWLRTHDRAACGRRIGMCGYMSVPLT